MTNEKRAEIETLARICHQAEMKVQAMGFQNVPNEPKEKEQQAVDFAIAGAELLGAKRDLQSAMASD
jgi:hypothetical protein